MKIKKVGFVLGGGGSRGFAHLGACQALYDRNIRPDVITCVSAGSIVGAFLSAGYQPQNVFELLKDDSIFQYLNVKFPVKGLLELKGLEKKIDKVISIKNIEDLPIELIICATNLNTGNLTEFRSGPLGLLVKASSSIPVLFEPVEYNNCQYVDGGIISNLPIEPLLGKCEKIVAINVTPTGISKKFPTMVQISLRCFMLAVTAKASNLIEQCDIFIEPPSLKHHGFLSSGKSSELYKIGYDHASRVLDKLESN